MAFKPKPNLHFKDALKDNNNTFIFVKPCGFCNQGFHCMDVVITSCKHTFHLFCLGAMLKESNKCYICNVKLHPDWWTSWGFRELDDELLELAKEMNLNQARDDIMTKAKEATTYGLELEPKKLLFKFDLACLMFVKILLFSCYNVFYV
jgi:hypothetical protein